MFGDPFFLADSVSVTTFDLDKNNTKETGKEFDDVKSKLDSIGAPPDGAGPVQFIKDFGDTATLMLTVASRRWTMPKSVCVPGRCSRFGRDAKAQFGGARVTIAISFPWNLDVREISEPLARMKEWLRETGAMSEASLRTERGFTLLDGQSSAVDEQLRVAVERFLHEETQGDQLHADAWRPVLVRPPAELASKLRAANADLFDFIEERR